METAEQILNKEFQSSSRISTTYEDIVLRAIKTGMKKAIDSCIEECNPNGELQVGTALMVIRGKLHELKKQVK